jgi:cob(I)alamin adenosyltransferase
MRSLLIRLLATAYLLAPVVGIAQAETAADVAKFITIAQSKVKTHEASEALRNMPEELFRWGKETCNWVRIGKANFEEVEKNLAEFWGDDLAAALVHSARIVVCPELTDKAAASASEPAARTR